MEPKDRIICALDVSSTDTAVGLVKTLRGHVGVFKVGLELVTAVGVQVFARLRDAGAERMFYDAKLHDIPNTVAGAMRGVTCLGAWCVTVHASGGSAMLRAAVEAAEQGARASGWPRPQVLAVTALTSIGETALRDELHVGLSMNAYVGALARLAADAGCDGVIASPHEIATVRAAVPDPGFLVVTPGVRPAGSSAGDQARVMTPRSAVELGADYLVIGRPITGAPDPACAADEIAQEISGR
ncbi:MAG TPA: orotidine-5'-phosphate decarboxylase [Chthonomonadaceae bacterium]|nr:orotidine-5'-phosphate decarboxylase [Chthonomonadaceae bacterium]